MLIYFDTLIRLPSVELLPPPRLPLAAAIHDILLAYEIRHTALIAIRTAYTPPSLLRYNGHHYYRHFSATIITIAAT